MNDVDLQIATTEGLERLAKYIGVYIYFKLDDETVPQHRRRLIFGILRKLKRK